MPRLKLLTVPAAGKRLRIAQRTARKWAEDGLFGKTRRITTAEREATGLPWNTRVVRDPRYVERLAKQVAA